MFPKEGETIPRIRFSGFTDDWEQRKLSEACDYVDYRGKTPHKTDDGVFLVTAKNIKDGYIDYEASKEYISPDDYEEVMHRGKPQIGDVLITTEAPCGNVAQVDKANIALAQRVIKYRGHSEVDNTFLKYTLLAPRFQTKLSEAASGGTVSGIKGSILHELYLFSTSFRNPSDFPITDARATSLLSHDYDFSRKYDHKWSICSENRDVPNRCKNDLAANLRMQTQIIECQHSLIRVK